jgi:hypothetical protein
MDNVAPLLKYIFMKGLLKNSTNDLQQSGCASFEIHGMKLCMLTPLPEKEKAYIQELIDDDAKKVLQ